MSFRTLLITSKCKLSYKNEHLYVRNDELKMIHLSEIEHLIIDSTQVIVTTYLLCELIKRKIFVVFCDEVHHPQSQLLSFYGSHNSSKRIKIQIGWEEQLKEVVWTEIVTEKIRKQSELLELNKRAEYQLLQQYMEDVKVADITNREGHAAKVYFNAMFGKKFTRDDCCINNKALNYGYAILLSFFNKEIVSNGYLTQLGICHKNEFNQFNLSCDFMEPFRVLVDKLVVENNNREFDRSFKNDLINVLNLTVKIDGKSQYVANAIKIYTKSLLEALSLGQVDKIKFYQF